MKSNRYVELLTPSVTSGLIVAVLALVVVSTVSIVELNDRGLLNEVTVAVVDLGRPIFESVTNWLAQNSILSNLPLLIFWSAVGAFVYVVGSKLFSMFSETVAVSRTFQYVNVSQDRLVRSILINLAVRAAAFFAWLLFCKLTLRVLFPYLTNVIEVGVTKSSVLAVPYLLAGLVGMGLTFHIYLVFIRLIALRARIFG